MILRRLADLYWRALPLAAARVSPSAGATLGDGLFLLRWPPVAVAAPLAAAALGVILGTSRDEVSYTGSLFVMGVLLGCGLVSANLGCAALLGYAVADFLTVDAPILYAGRDDLEFRASLILSYAVLALLVVGVPLLVACARTLVPRIPRVPALADAAARIAAGAAAAGLLVDAWAQSAAVLIRPVFTWVGGQPATTDIMPLQEQASALVVTAVVVAAVRPVLERVLPATAEERRAAEGFAFWLPVLAARRLERGPAFDVAASILAAAAATALMSGLFTRWRQALVVFAFLAGVLVVRALVQRSRARIVDLLTSVPLLVRIVVGVIAGSALARALVDEQDWATTDDFTPLLVAACASIAVIALIAVNRPRPPGGEWARRP